MEPLDHFIHAPVPLETGPALGGEEQVLPQRHVRKQRVVLKDVAAVALLWPQVYMRDFVEQNLFVEQDTACIGARETCNAIERERFAGAAGSEQRSDAGARLQFDFERECGGIRLRRKALGDARLNHPITWRCCSRLAA